MNVTKRFAESQLMSKAGMRYQATMQKICPNGYYMTRNSTPPSLFKFKQNTVEDVTRAKKRKEYLNTHLHAVYIDENGRANKAPSTKPKRYL
jgi:hypothetical protein